MPDSVLHVVLDTNILSDFLYDKATKSHDRVKRSRILISSVMQSKWPRIRLYTPAICIAETLGIIDKYRFASWKGEFKKDPSILLSPDEYEKIRSLLFKMTNSEVLEQLEHEPKHTLMASLISPVNCNFDDPSEPNKTRIMGATDCVIIGMATHLTNRLGSESVILVTGDTRMANVTKLAKNYSESDANELGLIRNAKELGIKWSNKIYPNVVNLDDASESDLKMAFGDWPLPTNKINYPDNPESILDAIESTNLYSIWESIKCQKEYQIWNQRKRKMVTPTIDKLPYTKAINAIQSIYAKNYGKYITCKDISWTLLNKRKSNKPSTPETIKDSEMSQPSLFDVPKKKSTNLE